jgi:hypothetical protein
MLRTGLLLLVLGLTWALPLAAADAPPSRDAQRGALLTVLDAPHPQVDAFHLRRMGPEIGTLLVEFATMPRPASAQDHQRRLRSLAWLQYLPSAQSRAVLLEVWRARDSDVATRRVALRALAAGFGAEALPLVREALTDRNLWIREAAAFAAGDIDDRRVQGIVADALEREPELAVRDALMASLQAVARRERARQN